MRSVDMHKPRRQGCWLFPSTFGAKFTEEEQQLLLIAGVRFQHGGKAYCLSSSSAQEIIDSYRWKLSKEDEKFFSYAYGQKAKEDYERLPILTTNP